MSNLIALGDLKTLLNIDDNQYDSLLKLLNTSVSSLIETYCDRHFSDGTYTEYHDGEGMPDLYTTEWPITSVMSIYDDVNRQFESSSLIDSTTYVIYADEGRISIIPGSILYSQTTFAEGVQNVKVTYRAGYTTIPADLQIMATEVIGKKYKNIVDKRWGMTNIGSAGENFSIFADDLLPEHRRFLDMKYRHRGSQ